MYLPGIGAGVVGTVGPGGLEGRSGSAATVKTQSVCIIVVRELGILSYLLLIIQETVLMTKSREYHNHIHMHDLVL